MQVSDCLEITGEGSARRYRCRRCEHPLGPAAENYKLAALVEETALTEANPHVGDPRLLVDEEMVYRRFYCPGCAALLETEVARARDVPLHDIEID